MYGMCNPRTPWVWLVSVRATRQRIRRRSAVPRTQLLRFLPGRIAMWRKRDGGVDGLADLDVGGKYPGLALRCVARCMAIDTQPRRAGGGYARPAGCTARRGHAAVSAGGAGMDASHRHGGGQERCRRRVGQRQHRESTGQQHRPEDKEAEEAEEASLGRYRSRSPGPRRFMRATQRRRLSSGSCAVSTIMRW